MSGMQYTLLAPDFRISKILTGLWQVADMERDGRSISVEAAAQAMQQYSNAGFTTFDMADHYGSAEVIAGIFNRKYAGRPDIQLLTKWVPRPGLSGKEEVRQAVQRSLDRMQLNCLPVLQYHAWNYADPNWLNQLFWLQELKEEGLIQHLGLTNFDTAHLRIAVKSGIPIVSNQISFSLLDQRAKDQMLHFSEQEGVKILAFGTLAGGFLTEKWLDQPEPEMSQLATWSQMKYKRFIDVAGGWRKLQDLLHLLKEEAGTYKVSIANIATRFILEHDAVGGVIIGARLGENTHIAENLRVFDFSLSMASRTRIKAQLTEFQGIPGNCGDEYRKPPYLTAAGDLSHHLKVFPAPYPVQSKQKSRPQVSTGTGWEEMAGYCRAIKVKDRILISGTTATLGDRLIGGDDPAAQMDFIIDKIEGALQSLGSKLEAVVRTRIYVQHLRDWEAVARVHGQRFRHISPANTLVRADLVGNGYLVEMEAEAVVNSA